MRMRSSQQTAYKTGRCFCHSFPQMRLRLPAFSRRTWVGIGIAAGIIALAAISSASWYGYRVYTELSPGSWRAPTEVLDRDKNTLVALYGSDWRVAEPV